MLTYLRLILIFFISGSSYGASVVKKISKSKVVKLDEGSAAGFDKGARVCVYSDSGKRAACGKVVKTAEDKSYVRISRKRSFRRVKVGMEARLYKKNRTSKQTDSTAKEHRNNIKFGYLFTAMSPTSYNNVLYNAPTNSTQSLDSLWKKDAAVSSSVIGAFGEGEFAVGQSYAVAIGLRYIINSATNAVSDYNISEPTKFVESTQSGSAIGFYTDFTFLDVSFTPSFFWRLSSGLDFEMSSVAYEAIQKDDSGSENSTIATYKSSITTASLRLGTNLNLLAIGPIGFVLGTNLLVPLAEFGKSSTADVTDPQTSQISVQGDTDLINAVDHKKSSFAAQVVLGTYLSF